MNDTQQKQLGSTLWTIADKLRGAMNADDFRDYMLSFLFLRYLSDNYEEAVKKELGSDYQKSELEIQKNGEDLDSYIGKLATVYKGNIIKNLIMDCQSYAKYRPNETTGGIFVSWRRKEELPTGA